MTSEQLAEYQHGVRLHVDKLAGGFTCYPGTPYEEHSCYLDTLIGDIYSISTAEQEYCHVQIDNVWSWLFEFARGRSRGRVAASRSLVPRQMIRLRKNEYEKQSNAAKLVHRLAQLRDDFREELAKAGCIQDFAGSWALESLMKVWDAIVCSLPQEVSNGSSR